ncbi:EAL domain-containing protein [Mycobacterium sp. 236(2023)]|uniref:sensor domain-containing phosphodiesterase n=1 Tax=Mycobacterium sp. 236(2023) TaxID=3038163 RepID=UPI002415221B|nr:EAL domain-containing protein [Mycobacterium sp. 236(2023)]MDG4668021.1 EAL domain-containing protein [Mycobacterium sp. 236(2023)]
MERFEQALTALMDPAELMRRIAKQSCLLAPCARGAGISLYAPGDHLAIVATCGTTVSEVGRIIELDSDFQLHALKSGRGEVAGDIYIDTRITPAARGLAWILGLRSWLAVPLIHRKEPLGVLSVLAAAPDAFSEADVEAIDSLSRILSAVLESTTNISQMLADLFGTPTVGSTLPRARFLTGLLNPDEFELLELQEGIDTLLEPDGIQAVFQPIVDISTCTVVAVEALSRFPHAAHRDPAQWFAIARRLGRGVELELLALKTALIAATDLAPELPLAVNLSPAVALNPQAHRLLESISRPVVVELTEHEPFPAELATRLKPLRRLGIDVAIDDAGSGFANFAEILRLRPDVIKIDADIVAGVDEDPARQALTTALVLLADELGAVTTAEGVETDGQRIVLHQLGVRYGQGFHFGRPRPIAELAS